MNHHIARMPRSVDGADEVFMVRERNAEARNAEGTRCSFAAVHRWQRRPPRHQRSKAPWSTSGALPHSPQAIRWWPPQFLIAGVVTISTACNGRIDAANRDGRNLKISWTGAIYDLEYWVIPTGKPNKDAALKFIAFASQTGPQADYARNIPTDRPTTRRSRTRPESVGHRAAEFERCLAVQFQVLADQGEQLEKRFASWAAQ